MFVHISTELERHVSLSLLQFVGCRVLTTASPTCNLHGWNSARSVYTTFCRNHPSSVASHCALLVGGTW